MQIVNLFYEIARQNKRLRGFTYNKSYQQGAGNSMYPLMWLDDPIMGQSMSESVMRYTVNVDILGLPSETESEQAVQSSAFDVGLSVIYRIRSTRATTGVSVEGFSFVSLREYYDDGAAGYRFTLTLLQANPTDKCLDDYDATKVFPSLASLPDFSVDNPDGCAVFTDSSALPTFKLD